MAPSRRAVIHALAGMGLASVAGRAARAACDLPGAHIDVQRVVDRPIIHAGLDPSIGANIQGPSLIRTPDWLPNRLGRYYLYFADHKGSYIRLAYADQPRRTLGNPCSRLDAPAGVELPDRAAAGARGEVPRTAAERCPQSGGQRRHPAHRLTRCTRAGRPARNRYVFPRARGTFVSAFARCRLAGRHQLHCLAGHHRQVVHARVSP